MTGPKMISPQTVSNATFLIHKFLSRFGPAYWGILVDCSLVNCSSSSKLYCFPAVTLTFTPCHKFSMDWDLGSEGATPGPCPSKHCWTTCMDVCLKSLSCWKTHQWPNHGSRLLHIILQKLKHNLIFWSHQTKGQTLRPHPYVSHVQWQSSIALKGPWVSNG